MLLKPTTALARGFQSFLRWRAFQGLLALLIFINLVALLPPNRIPTTNFGQDVNATHSNLNSSHEAAPKIGRVFITALLKDNEDILQAGWSDAVVNLTRTLGPENVWISIHESGSQDGTKRELHMLDMRLRELGAGTDIKMADLGEDMHTMMPKDGSGWLEVKGKRRLRRIPWLAGLRNINIESLTRLTAKNITLDKILFLNDVVFTSDDALELLRTHNGEYAAACGFDYARLWPSIAFYDQFATRDSDGQTLTSLYYPYFAEGKSRDALLADSPVPVKSCWSGIAAFDAAPFQDLTHPLRFRAIQDSLAEFYLEASECCLIHYDNPVTASKGVWMNPNVRVAYDTVRYDAAHTSSGWPSTTEATIGHLWELMTWILRLKGRWKVIDRRFEEWTRKSMLNSEIGLDCLVNKMMVVSEKGRWHEIKEHWF